MTKPSLRARGSLICAALLGGVLPMAQPPVAVAREKAVFDATATLSKFSDPGCLFDAGKVKANIVNGQEITADKKGCLAITGTDGKTYYVNRAAKKVVCPKRLAQGPVATVTAGSAGANECKD
jgi:hypothetical protein